MMNLFSFCPFLVYHAANTAIAAFTPFLIVTLGTFFDPLLNSIQGNHTYFGIIPAVNDHAHLVVLGGNYKCLARSVCSFYLTSSFSNSLFHSQSKSDYAACCHATCTDINTIPAYENANNETTRLDLWVIDIKSVGSLYLSKLV